MKTKILRKLMLIAVLLTSSHAFAYDFEVDGIYYNVISVTKLTVGVTYKDRSYNTYSGSVFIPKKLAYNNKTYTVISIDDYAFYGCCGLTSVTIPNSVTGIGDYAFYGCSGLTSIDIPDSVSAIAVSAFNNCSSLASITIPCSVKRIGNYAFNGCIALKELQIEDGTNTLFLGSNDYNYLSAKGLFFDCPVERLHLGRNLSNDNGPSHDYYSPFSDKLKLITIGDSVTSIGDRAFSGCTGLISVTIPENVTSIGNFAFEGCTDLSSVEFNAVNCTAKQTRLSAFHGCDSLENLTIGEKVTNIPNYIFTTCSGLTLITCKAKTPPTLYGLSFGYKSNLKIYIPNFADIPIYKTTEGWSEMFFVPRKIDDIYYMPISTSEVEVTYKDKDYNSYGGDVVIPEDVTIDSVIYKVAGIGKNAFMGCSDLVSITCKAKTPPILGNNNASFLYNVNIKIPCFANILTYKAAEGWSDLLFAGHEIDGLYYHPMSDNEAVVTFKDKDYNSYGGDVVIPEEIMVDSVRYKITGINKASFYKCDGLTSVTMPNFVISIGSSAFADCDSLSSITIPDGIASIGRNAFSGCSSLVSVEFNAINCIEMGDYKFPVFAGCDSLANINLGEKVTTIPNYAFYGCSGLTNVTIPNGVTSIGSGAFYDCRGLTEIIIGKKVGTIGVGAFAEIGRLGKIYSLNPIPPTCADETVFASVNKEKCQLIVPQGCDDDYKSTYVWWDFNNVTSKDLSAAEQTLVDDNSAEIEYYNLQGVKVENPSKGIYVKKQGSKITKVVL